MADNEYSSKHLINAIQQGVETKAIGVTESEPFLTRPVYNPPEPDPDHLAASLTIHTLTGIVDYLKNHGSLDASLAELAEGETALAGLAVHVVSESEVRVIGTLTDFHRQREILIVGKFESLTATRFQFGAFLPQEEFVIALQSLFEDVGDRPDILRVVGRIVESSVKESSDDGIGQQVEARVGVATVQNVAVPNPVTLRPYRTFREIEQPESKFILRVRAGANGNPPTCALFEADGGKWRLDAIERIRDFLKANLEETEIPIIA